MKQLDKVSLGIFPTPVHKLENISRLLGDKSNTIVFDNSKVKRAVPDFVCTVRADQGLRKTVRNMLATPALQREDPEFDRLCDRIIAALEAAKETILKA